MTKTRLTIILVFVFMMMSQLVSFADSGLVEVEVGINDSKVYFNNKALNNDELAFPFIRYNDVIYFPLAWNSLKAIGYQPIAKEGSTDLNLIPLEQESVPTLDEKAGKPVSGIKKAEIKKADIKINNESIKNGEYPVLKFNNILYMPLTWDVLNQLGLYYSADDLGDMHISSLSKKALDESVSKANDAYVNKLIKFVKSVNRSLPDSEAERYVNAILKESATYGIDETWIFAMVWQESRFNATCEYKGAVGIMQILVSTGKNFGLTKQDLLVPEKSIRAGVQYIKSGFDRFGSIEKAILAYNQGSYRVEKGNYSTWYLDEIKEKREALLKKTRLIILASEVIMPHLRFRAMEETAVIKLSDLLAEPLSFVLNCPADYFSFEWIPSHYYFSGERVSGVPTVEIIWFDRGQYQQDLVAQMVHERLVELGCEETTIIFTNVPEAAYYDNGQHY